MGTLLGGFVIPLFIVSTINAILYFAILWNIGEYARQTRAPGQRTVQRRQQLRAGMSVFVLLGLSWLFGALLNVPGQAQTVFEYLFVLCTTLQGLAIFIMHCVLNDQVQESVQNMLRGSHGEHTSAKRSNKPPVTKPSPLNHGPGSTPKKSQSKQPSKSIADRPSLVPSSPLPSSLTSNSHDSLKDHSGGKTGSDDPASDNNTDTVRSPVGSIFDILRPLSQASFGPSDTLADSGTMYSRSLSDPSDPGTAEPLVNSLSRDATLEGLDPTSFSEMLDMYVQTGKAPSGWSESSGASSLKPDPRTSSQEALSVRESSETIKSASDQARMSVSSISSPATNRKKVSFAPEQILANPVGDELRYGFVRRPTDRIRGPDAGARQNADYLLCDTVDEDEDEISPAPRPRSHGVSVHPSSVTIEEDILQETSFAM